MAALRREASESVGLAVQSRDSRAVKLLDRALELYAQLARESDDAVDLHNWAVAHMLRARRAQGDEAETSYRQANALFLRAEESAEGIAAYSLAASCAALGDEDGCRRWLEEARSLDMLPDRVDIISDPEFVGVLDRPWFVEVLDSLPAPEDADDGTDEPGFRPGRGCPGAWQ